MKNNYTLRFYLTLAATVAIGAAWFMRPWAGEIGKGNAAKPAATAGSSGAAAPAKERKIKYWTDPMIPGYRAEGPGKSPMNMDLVPVYEDGGETPGMVNIRPEMVQSLGVRTALIEERNIEKTVRASGLVAYDETRVANIQPKVSGWVEKLYINYTGQEVEKGEFMLELYSPELVETEEEFLLAVKSREAAPLFPDPNMAGMGTEEMYEAARNRLRYLDVPDHQIFDIEFKKKIKKTLHIHSPFNGVVVAKLVSEGMQVSPGMTLYTVADLSHVWVLAEVYEYELQWVRPGIPAEITLTAYPGKTFRGKVTYIYPFMEKEARTVKVRIEIPNPNGELKPDMFAQTVFHSGARARGVVVPKEAVIRSGRRDTVIITLGDGRYAPREVELGLEMDDAYEIRSGLAKGERVVTSAQFLIDSESSLREAAGKLLPPEPDSAAPAAATDHSAMDHSKMDSAGHEMEDMTAEVPAKKPKTKKHDHSAHEGHEGHEAHNAEDIKPADEMQDIETPPGAEAGPDEKQAAALAKKPKKKKHLHSAHEGHEGH